MKSVQLIAIGAAPSALLKELEPVLQSQLALSATLGKSALGNPTYAFNKDRNQYHSNAIMRRLVPLLPSPQEGILALSDVDLFVPDSAFIFGEADRESRVALLSVSRLKAPGGALEGEPLRRRVQVEGLHLAGHLVGLSYCEDARCAMFLATTVQEVDRKQVGLCHVCRNELAKLSGR